MSRGIGEFQPIQESVPEWFAVLIGLITQLGDGWFLIALLTILYWTRKHEQDDILLVGGTLACGIGLYRGLKYLFELPRPDRPLLDPELLPWVVRPVYEATAFASGYGFPSGHATMTTIVYFGLATVLTTGPRRLRFFGAGTIVALVGFSRVALGVHYLVDIVAGVFTGAVLLYLTLQFLERVPFERGSILFAVAVVLNAFYVVTSDGGTEAIIMVGVSLGLFGGWQLILLARQLVTVDRPSEGFRPTALRLGLAGASLVPLGVAFEEFSAFGGDPYPIAGIAGLGVTVAIIIPVARYSDRVQRVTTALSFWARTALSGVLVLVRPATWRRIVRELKQLWQDNRP